MENITNKKTGKNAVSPSGRLLEFAKMLRADGKTDREISQIIGDHLKLEKKKSKKKPYSDIVEIDFKSVLTSIEAKSSAVLIELLDYHKLKFDIGYRIGSYEFILVEKNIVVEIQKTDVTDLQNDARDRFLMKFGYDILYISENEIRKDPDNVIFKIRSLID